MNKTFIAIILAFSIGVVSTLLIVSALYQTSVHFSSVAAVKTVGVAIYWDPAFTVPVVNMNWGVIEPGTTKNVSCYIVNTSNVPVSLTLAVNNWQPTSASNYVSLTWNYDEQPIPVSGYTPITFSLHVDPATTGITGFSFDITITGSG
jgi:hypothetical protein